MADVTRAEALLLCPGDLVYYHHAMSECWAGGSDLVADVDLDGNVKLRSWNEYFPPSEVQRPYTAKFVAVTFSMGKPNLFLTQMANMKAHR